MVRAVTFLIPCTTPPSAYSTSAAGSRATAAASALLVPWRPGGADRGERQRTGGDARRGAQRAGDHAGGPGRVEKTQAERTGPEGPRDEEDVGRDRGRHRHQRDDEDEHGQAQLGI